MGAGQTQAGQGSRKKKRPFFAPFHHMVVPPAPDHAQGDPRQARTGPQIPGQGSVGQGQTVQKTGKMKTVRNQADKNVLPSIKAHKIHGPVPPGQHFQIKCQRLQHILRHFDARIPDQAGQFRPVHRFLPHVRHLPSARIFRPQGRIRPFIAPLPGTCKPRPDNVQMRLEQKCPVRRGRSNAAARKVAHDARRTAFSRPGLTGAGHGP